MHDNLVWIRKVKYWRGRKYVYRIPMKAKNSHDAGFFYCPYIPFSFNSKVHQ